MRRWLQFGVASAGMGAALLGFGLVGPGQATAGADTGAESSASADSSESADSTASESSSSSTRATKATRTPKVSEADDETGGDAETDAADDDVEDADVEDAADAADADAAAAADADDPASVSDLAEVEDDESFGLETDGDLDDVNIEFDSTAIDLAAPISAPATSMPPYESWQSPYQKRVAEILQGWTDRHQAWVDSLDIPQDRKERLTASFLAMRRTFFNQAPTVAPIQITGVITGPIIGSLGGADADGDRLLYRMTRGPKTGTVTFNDDGTYTYVPGAGFDGVDTFYVSAIDLGLHVNLLQPLRPLGSGLATSLINQGAVHFDWEFGEGAGYWDLNPGSRAALQRAADELVQHFRVTRPVSLTYRIRGYEDAASGALAGASSPLVRGGDGFWKTRISYEIITGRDPNGDRADGFIQVNFAQKWEFSDGAVPSDRYDFTTTIMHELLHSFGFAVLTGQPRRWHDYARFVVTDQRESIFNPDYTPNTKYNDNLSGKNNGLFFSGPNAVAANGGQLVRLYTPPQFAPGSSLSHLDLQTFLGYLMAPAIDTGGNVRTLSNVELGILKDLGYTVVPLVALPTAV